MRNAGCFSNIINLLRRPSRDCPKERLTTNVINMAKGNFIVQSRKYRPTNEQVHQSDAKDWLDRLARVWLISIQDIQLIFAYKVRIFVRGECASNYIAG
jgi:hypothetical protein